MLTFLVILTLLGAGWGVTQPLAKLAVSTGHQPLTLVFWQLVVGALALGALCLMRGRLTRLSWPQLRRAIAIALIGTILPAMASYRAAVHLPAGILAILLSLIPMIGFPIALILGTDRFELRRLAGLILGLIAVLIIVAPEASLPDPAMVAFIPLALIAPVFYALEGNVVARWGMAGLDAIQLLFWASAIGAGISGAALIGIGGTLMPPALGDFAIAEYAILGTAVIHAAVYTIYVWLVTRAGAVFAVQVSYLVTLFGVLWAMWLLGERFSQLIWLAFGVMMLGMALVQPRLRDGQGGHSDHRGDQNPGEPATDAG
jgi:drug/metabolite transporter (DMT)-like permease